MSRPSAQVKRAGALRARSGAMAGSTCCLCLQGINFTSREVKIYKCGHKFHKGCEADYAAHQNLKYDTGNDNDEWLRCPQCKMDLPACLDLEQQAEAAGAVAECDVAEEDAVVDALAEAIGAKSDDLKDDARAAMADHEEAGALAESDGLKEGAGKVSRGLRGLKGPEELGSVKLPCDNCGGLFAPASVKVKSKRSQTFQCSGCKVKVSTLQRHFGSWPPPGWGLLTAEQQQQFFAQSKSGKADLLRQLKLVTTQRDDKRKGNDWVGGFYPASWCERQGFDVSKLADVPEEWKE